MRNHIRYQIKGISTPMESSVCFSDHLTAACIHLNCYVLRCIEHFSCMLFVNKVQSKKKSFMGVSGIHEFYFSKNTSEASHVSWEDYDYKYKSEAYMLDREFTRHGRHPPIVERPMPRVENMSEFYNPTWPSHFINGPLIRKRRVYASHELRQATTVGGPLGLNQSPAYFTRSRSSPVRRPRSHSRSPSKTPERRRSHSRLPTRSPIRCLDIRSCTRSRSASYTRSRSGSPSYCRSSPSLYGRDSLHKYLGIRKIF